MRQLTSNDPRPALHEARDRCVPRGRPGRTGGFTLVELLVTIAVAGILAVIGVPALRTFLQNDRQWTNANSLVMSLNAARSEAIKQDAPVSVCPTTNGTSCSTTAAWAQGWIVLSSVANSVPVLTIPALPTGTSLTEANALTAVTFQSTGTVSAPAAFTLCDSRGGTYARYVQVTLTGSIASSPTVGKNTNGAALTCP